MNPNEFFYLAKKSVPRSERKEEGRLTVSRWTGEMRDPDRAKKGKGLKRVAQGEGRNHEKLAFTLTQMGKRKFARQHVYAEDFLLLCFT